MLISVNKEQQVLQSRIPVLPSKLKKIERGMNISFLEGLQCLFQAYREVLWRANNKVLCALCWQNELTPGSVSEQTPLQQEGEAQLIFPPS